MLIEMTIKGLMLDPITNTPIVILKDKDGDRVLPIWVGLFEANAIALQIENVATPRPMTHDLLRNIITDLDGRVDRIVVSDLKENTFYAIVHLTVRGERVAVDARPSDAIALALRTRAPILVEENVIENAKTVDFGSERLDNEKVQKWLEALDPAELLHDAGEHQAWSSKGTSSRRTSAPRKATPSKRARHTSAMVAAPAPWRTGTPSSPPISAGAR